MSKKKKESAKDLVDLKMNEVSEINLESKDLDLNLDDLGALEVANGDMATADVNRDATIRLVHTNASKEVNLNEPVQEGPVTSEEKISYGLPAKQQVPKTSHEDVVTGDVQLKQSEHLRIAQRKMNELETEVNKLRRENEDLAAAAETFKKLNDEYFANVESLKAKIVDHKQTHSQEVDLLKRINASKEKMINELKQQIDSYKSRIDNDFQRVRKREKDLAHRLEIAKMEEAALVTSKDQLILDLKRRIDEVSHESNNFRMKSQENYKELQKKQQVVRGAIRALRIALTKLEGDDDSDFGIDSAPVGSEDDQ